MALKQDEVIRPIANYAPSHWGDQFLDYEEVRMLQRTTLNI